MRRRPLLLIPVVLVATLWPLVARADSPSPAPVPTPTPDAQLTVHLAPELPNLGQGTVLEASRQVSADPSTVRAYVEPTLSVDPANHNILAVASAQAYSAKCHFFVSNDGGQSWVQRSSPQPADWEECLYSPLGPVAAVSFSPDGSTLYCVMSVRHPSDWRPKMFVATSKDLGATWQSVMLTPQAPPNTTTRDLGSYGLPSIAVDPTHPQRVYVAFESNYNAGYHLEAMVAALPGSTRGDWPTHPFLSVSEDGGRTFSPPKDISDSKLPEATKATLRINDPTLAVGPDGKLFVFYGATQKLADTDPNKPASYLIMASSTDGGATLATKSIVTRANFPDGIRDQRPAIDARNGNMYVVWEDMAKTDPQGIAFIASIDRGSTWGAPVRLSEFTPPWNNGWNAWLPNVSVAPGGRVDVAWYDYRNDYRAATATDYYKPDNGAWLQDVYYSYSIDSGKNWSKNIRITDRSMDRQYGVWETAANYEIRGPIGIVSTDDTTYFAWDDTRNATAQSQSQDAYFTKLRFPVTAAPAAAADTSSSSSSSTGVWLGVGIGAGVLAIAGIAMFVIGRRRSASAVT